LEVEGAIVMMTHRRLSYHLNLILARILRTSVFLCLLLIILTQFSTPQNLPHGKETQIFPERTSRDEWQKPVEIVEALNLKPGDAVADIGSGAGYFTGWLSQAVGPQGRVYAVDINAEAIRLLSNKIEFYPVKNIKPVLCTETDLKLEPQSLDVAFMLNTFSVVKEKETMLSNVMTVLNPRGRLAIIDWKALRDGPPGPPRDQRLSEEGVVNMARRAGFRLAHRYDLLPSQFFLEFVKDNKRRPSSLARYGKLSPPFLTGS
jgi:arsenite methyltransferase